MSTPLWVSVSPNKQMKQGGTEVPSSPWGLCLGKTWRPSLQGMCIVPRTGPPRRGEDGRQAGHWHDWRRVRGPSPGEQTPYSKTLGGQKGLCVASPRWGPQREGEVRKTNFALELQRNRDGILSAYVWAAFTADSLSSQIQKGDHILQG